MKNFFRLFTKLTNPHVKLSWIGLIVGCLFLVNCSKQDELSPDPNRKTILLKGTIEGITKATETGFEEGDAVGIYIVDYADASTPGTLSPSGNRASNIKHLYQSSDNSWQPSTGQSIYWKDETTKIDVYGYYPHNTTIPASMTAYNFAVQTDQSTAGSEEALGGYEASDFLWAKTEGVAPQESPILLTFGHKMSKVVITLIGGTGFEAGLPQSDISVKIKGTKASASLDLTTGVASVNASSSPQTITTLKDGDIYKAIVVPQTLEQSTTWIEVTIGTDVFTYSGTYTFIPNKQHNLTLTLNKTATKGEIQLSSNNITLWEEDEPTYGDANQVSNEREALIALYQATNGDQWKYKTNWCTDEPLDTWYGVTTDEEGHVNTLTLPYNNLNGEIPAEIGNLTKLTSFYLHFNQLSGEIPTEIGNLTNLTDLTLFSNQLSGEIPAEIGNLTNLTSLPLYSNQLSGEIPTEIGNLTKLTSLSLSSNQLRGAIPAEIWNLTNLTSLYLDGNNLSGEIPTEIGNLTNLTTLSLSSNQLSGELPAEIGNLTKLINLTLNNNQLSGEIPESVRNHPHWNDWVPSIHIFPQQEGYGFTNLGIGENSRDREALMAFYNATGGQHWSKQTNWGTEQPLETWYGITTNENGVSHIKLESNQLSGEIPAEIENLTNLTALYLRSNQLSGEIPTEIGNLTKLNYLGLGSNQLSGEIPAEIENLTKLNYLNLSQNQLSGEIPAAIGNLANLTTLFLNSNQLSGEIPAEIGNLTKLNYLGLDGNNLSGEIPATIGNLPNLTLLYLANNQLSGEIPVSLKNNPRWSLWKNSVITQQPGYGFTNVDD